MNALQRLAGGAATAFALFALTAPALAGGSLKDKPAEPRRCTFSANVALATEYVFRGFSQTAQNPAVQGGFDATCGMFYAGVWASNLDFGAISPTGNVASIEMDWYGGIKFNTGKLAWDIGIIYYSYPGNTKLGANGVPGDFNYVEGKIGVSSEVWKGGTLGTTVYYSPNYTNDQGQVITSETTFSQVLPKVGIFTPTFSALYGYNKNLEDNGSLSQLKYFFDTGNFKDHYSYWNAGVTFAFMEKWSLDIRYWDTDVSNAGGFCNAGIFQCDERVVGTLKFTY